jgi:ribosomal protein L17
MMRHGRKIHRVGRPADQRKALLRALTTQLLTHGAIKTTKQKAKAVRPWVDKMIVLAKDGSDDKKKQARGVVGGVDHSLPLASDASCVSRPTRGCMTRRLLTASSRRRRSAMRPA